QAERWGLATELHDEPLARAMELAETIANKSPSATRAAKRLIDYAERNDRTEVLMRETEEQVELIGQADQMEVIAAQMQGRKPKFG
ncbi:MAG: enoyl-CoA hydratase, partial [Paracoccaceae bacterium]